ncbi:MAG: tandem-95 repeat protein [Gemmataceae bacterium]
MTRRLPPRRPRRLSVEPLEARLTPSVYTEAEPNNPLSNANFVPVPTGDVTTAARTDWLSISGAIGSNSDVDYFKFTVSARSGVFFDIDSRETGLSSSLDASLNLYDAGGNLLTTNAADDGYDFEGFAVPNTATADASSYDPSLYQELTPGTYYIGVSSYAGASAGNYELRILADNHFTTTPPAFTSPSYSTSIAEAPYTLYLDCDGDNGSTSSTWGSYTAAPFNFPSGNTAEFTPAERLAIKNLYRIVAEDLSVFQVKVTTIAPPGARLADGKGFRMVVTGSDATIIGQDVAKVGASRFNSFADGDATNNVGFVFFSAFSNYGGIGAGLSGRIMARPVEAGNTASQYFGRACGLGFYNSASKPNAIMADPDTGLNREVWISGTNQGGNSQNDYVTLRDLFDTWPDDHGGSAQDATVAPEGDHYTLSGIIYSASDMFRIVASGATSIRVDVDEYVSNLDSRVFLLDANSNQLAVNDPSGTYDSSITMTLAPGIYFINVRAHSDSNDDPQWGPYTVRVDTTINQAPQANAGSATTAEDIAVSGTVTATDLNWWDTLSYAVVSGPAHGTLTSFNTATGAYTYRPNLNYNGPDAFTFRASDGRLNSNVATVSLQVTPVNDPPAFTGGANQTVAEDSGLHTVTGWATGITAGPPDESGQALMFLVSAGNTALFAVPPAISANGTLTFTPAANAVGSTTVTVRLQDNAGGSDTSGQQTFTITITAVNDPPSFTPGANQTVAEDAGAKSVPGWATAIIAGPPDESGQTVTFQVSADNTAVFAVQPAIAANGTLTFTPAADANGSAIVTVRLRDNAGGADTSGAQIFTITVTPVNDPPSFAVSGTVLAPQDGGPQTVPGWATAITAGPPNESSQGLTFLVSNDAPDLFDVPPAIAADGTLTFTPAAGEVGSTTVTVRLKDDAGGDDTSAPQLFTISILHVNQPPSFTVGANVTVDEDAEPQPMTNWATAISPGPAEESGQALTFQVSADIPSLFAAGPAISPTGTLTFTPAPNVFGTAIVTVRLKDDGGTLVGGVDTSGPQTFTITINPVNDAPVLSGTYSLTTVALNNTNPVGDAVGSFAAPWISDVDPGDPKGIAIVGMTGESSGTWQYSLDGGLTWSALAGASDVSARLLRSTDRVRFVPNLEFVGQVSLTFHAWDRTTGTAGGTADLSAVGSTGGTTAFSVASATAGLRVAPYVLSIPEDSVNPPGLGVGTVLGGRFTDSDPRAKRGIAVVDVSGNGVWQYRTSAVAAWVSLGVPNESAARLLPETYQVRFVPAPNWFGRATLVYRAWDQTTGTAGGFADLTPPGATGGATAYSVTTDQVVLSVRPINDRPVLDVGGDPPLTPVAPGATDPAGVTVAVLLGPAATDIDPGALRGIAVTAVSPTGTAVPTGFGWQYNRGSGWLPLTVSVGQVLPLGDTGPRPLRAAVRFQRPGPPVVPRWDQTQGTARTPLTLVAAAELGQPHRRSRPAARHRHSTGDQSRAESAPGAPTLTAIDEDLPSRTGDPVAKLLDGLFSDLDNNAVLAAGVAVTGVDPAAEVWQYSLGNRVTWIGFGTVAADNALLLPATARLRFAPAAGWFSGTSLNYQAWDRSRGSVAGRANLTVPFSSDGSSAIGVDNRTAGLLVRSTNDRPVSPRRRDRQAVSCVARRRGPGGQHRRHSARDRGERRRPRGAARHRRDRRHPGNRPESRLADEHRQRMGQAARAPGGSGAAAPRHRRDPVLYRRPASARPG